MIIKKISEKESAQRLDKYLKRLMPAAGSGFLYKMLRKKNILLNGKKAEGKERICPGDQVTLYFSEETFLGFRKKAEEKEEIASPFYPLKVLYETEDLVCVEKPSGLLSQKSRPEDISANELLRRQFEERDGYSPSVLNRLDRNTSGILLAAKTLYGAREASKWLREGSAKKIYHCLVAGSMETEQNLTAYLRKDPKSNQVRITERPAEGAVRIAAEYHPLRRFRKATLVSVQLLTGKSHQIRSHLSFLGFPILGDPKYGDRAENAFWKKCTGLDRQLLHATELYLPGEGEPIRSPYPADFAKVLTMLEEDR